MSISSTLSNAMSGLAISTKWAEVVSSNVANAMTDGFARRELTLETGRIAGGASGGEVVRVLNEQTLSERRLADASLAHANTLLTYTKQVETLIGNASTAGSFSMALFDFEASLDAAISRPDLTNRLEDVSEAANRVTETLNSASDGIQNLRLQADKEISRSVDRLNTHLENVQELNQLIVSAEANNRDSASLLDQRQSEIDAISELVPVKVLERKWGEVALISQEGAILLDGTAAEIRFEPTPTIVPHFSVENGFLSQVTINGRPVRGLNGGVLAGGQLGANFQIRDEYAVEIQAHLDDVAQDLALRFQDPALDSSLSLLSQGLFTDAGARVEVPSQTGLAGRLELNSLVDQSAGNELWRLRDGLGASTIGQSGDATLLTKMKAALSEISATTGQDVSIFQRASTLETEAATERLSKEERFAFAGSRQQQLLENQFSEGVNTDDEMQKLMRIEQLYAANARVVQTVDELLNTLIRM